MNTKERAVQVCEKMANEIGPREAYIRIAVSTLITIAMQEAVNTALEAAAEVVEAESDMFGTDEDMEGLSAKIRALKATQ